MIIEVMLTGQALLLISFDLSFINLEGNPAMHVLRSSWDCNFAELVSLPTGLLEQQPRQKCCDAHTSEILSAVIRSESKSP